MVKVRSAGGSSDFTEPYCGTMRGIIDQAAAELGLPLHSKGCYVCVEGPRYETPANSAYRRLGGCGGMTNVPEVVLAGRPVYVMQLSRW